MDREILLRQLVQAEQNVAEGKAFIANANRLCPIGFAVRTLEEPGGLLGIDEPARGVIKLERPFDAELQLLGQV
jgi:hypothetical protein